jgi:hypothetical protein
MSRHKNIILLCIFLFFAFLINAASETNKTEVSRSEKKIRLSWKRVEGAVSYKVMIRDRGGNVIFDKVADSNNIILEIQPGNYELRIGAVNKFNKIGSWSDWAGIKIREPEKEIEEKQKEEAKKEAREEEEKEKRELEEKEKKEEEKTPVKKDLFNLGLKFGAGLSYFYILPEWNEYYENSYTGITLNILYSFRRLSLPSSISFLKYSGIDLESTYVHFNGVKAFNRVESNLENIITGGSLLFTTNFNFPVNFTFRGGGGIVFTTQEYTKYDEFGEPAGKGTSGTTDLYYRAGISIEYRFHSSFFLEAYADYYLIKYLIKDFNAYRFSLLAGIRL